MKNEKPAALKPSRPEPGVSTGPQTFITISPEGEIAAWGLEQELENLILDLTGNRELIKADSKMAYDLCG
jgi:hypothetical protein